MLTLLDDFLCMQPTKPKQPGVVKLARLNPADVCQVMIGTSGYSYVEWVDSGFYPAGTKSPQMLSWYGRCFSVVELNYTWYQMARAEQLARMATAAPEHMVFAAKLTRSMTHEREADWREQVQLYRRGITALRKRLVAVLVQLPPDFDRTIGNRRFLAELLDRLQDLPLAVEFRHGSWATDTVFVELERRQVTLVTVDEPDLPGLFPSLDVVTNPRLFYARLHGRNLQGWRSANMQKKFDYDYKQEELADWSARYLLPMVRQSEGGIVFFNNHVRAQAPRNAQLLGELLATQAGGHV